MEILHAEVDRTVASIKRMRSIWESIAPDDQDDNAATSGPSAHATAAESMSAAQVVYGRRAYAHKQAAIYAQWEHEAEMCCERARSIRAGDRGSGKRDVDGRPKAGNVFAKLR